MSARVGPPLVDVGFFKDALTAVGMPTSYGPVPTSARVGRQRQRYGACGERLVAGCIPIRYPNGTSHPEEVKVMLISSRGGKGWVFPKGGWENDETLEAAAMRETVEEAGVRGRLEEPVIGTFSFHSAKQVQGRCSAYMFALHVAEELDVWPEGMERERCWVSMAEASVRCRHPWMRDALHLWMRRHGWESYIPAQYQQPAGQEQPAGQGAGADQFADSASDSTASSAS